MAPRFPAYPQLFSKVSPFCYKKKQRCSLFTVLREEFFLRCSESISAKNFKLAIWIVELCGVNNKFHNYLFKRRALTPFSSLYNISCGA